MKVQFAVGRVRIRISEQELSALLDGGVLRLAVPERGEALFAMELRFGDCMGIAREGLWRVTLPCNDVGSYAESLPRRDALLFPVEMDGGGYSLELEVDVRDSIRTRGAIGPSPNRRV